MKVAVILNGISLKKKQFYNRILPEISKVATVEVFETLTQHDAIQLAAKAVRGFDVILAAGGDGTLNQVVNGILRDNESASKLPVIGVVPLGTGNDFAKTIGLSSDPREIKHKLENFDPALIDIGKITCLKEDKNGVTYFINIVDVGMGPEVVRLVNNSDRLFGFSTTYYTAILRNFISYRPIHVNIETEGKKTDQRIRTFAVANGKYFGHGLCIAPDARLDDGEFETFTVGDVSVLDFILYSAPLKKGKKINHPKVAYGKARSVVIRSSVPAFLEADGELIGQLPATIEMLPQRLKFLL